LKVLEIHCSSFSYQVKKSTPVAEDPDPESENLKDVLVCFICFEKNDEDKVEELLDKLVKNVKMDISRIKCKSVLIYPYAHLSKKLGKPRLAKELLSELRNRLIGEKINTHKSPFGWYKSFSLECKGHPLAEAYREF